MVWGFNDFGRGEKGIRKREGKVPSRPRSSEVVLGYGVCWVCWVAGACGGAWCTCCAWCARYLGLGGRGGGGHGKEE